MEEMIEHCAQFVDEVNKGLTQPITKDEYIGQMKMYFPKLKRWRKETLSTIFGGVTDPNYCVLKFTATDGRFYSDYYPRSFVL